MAWRVAPLRLPAWNWIRGYGAAELRNDLIAALVVAVLLIPQALGLALVAGVPAQAGLYAAISGLTVYALFGSSRCLSVGPVAVLSLMTAAALARLPLGSPAEYAGAALMLSLLTGAILLVAGVLRLGFIANFIPRPVLAAFITASAILISLSQLQALLGVPATRGNALELFAALLASAGKTHLPTLALGLAAVALLLAWRRWLGAMLEGLGISLAAARSLARSGPIVLAALGIWLGWGLGLESAGVELLGEVPAGLPTFALPGLAPELLGSLLLSALPLAMVCYVESISVGQALAVRRHQSIEPNQELVGLGAANLASACSGGMPVAGGFARSFVNFEAGAATPAAGVYAAAIIAMATLFLTPALYWLPKVCLAAVILVAVHALLDFSMLGKSWRHSRSDFFAVAVTLVATLAIGAEAGIAAGALSAMLMHLYRTSQPHVAVVGRVPGTEHFRNVRHYDVETSERVLSLRIDEALYFPNARFLESLLLRLVAERPGVEHVILMCPAVNDIDLSALETLENINEVLAEAGIVLHLSEVKVPIMNKLVGSDFLNRLSGRAYLTQNQAFEDLRQLKPKAGEGD